MIIEAGHFALAVGLSLAVALTVLCHAGGRAPDSAIGRLVKIGLVWQAAAFAACLGAVIHACLDADLRIRASAHAVSEFTPVLFKSVAILASAEGGALAVLTAAALSLVALAWMSAPLRRESYVGLLIGEAILLCWALTLFFVAEPFAPPRPGSTIGFDPQFQSAWFLARAPVLLATGVLGFLLVCQAAPASLTTPPAPENRARVMRGVVRIAGLAFAVSLANGVLAAVWAASVGVDRPWAPPAAARWSALAGWLVLPWPILIARRTGAHR